MKITTVLIFYFLFFSFNYEAQNVFQVTQDISSGADLGKATQQTSDGGFIISGIAQNNTDDIFIIKLDALGNEQWKKIINIPSSDEDALAVAEHPNGGFIIQGVAKMINGLPGASSLGNEDFFLARVDVNGNLIWFNNYGSTGIDGWTIQNNAFSLGTNIQGANPLAVNADGTIVVAGYTRSFSSFDRVVLFKVDANGVLIWNQIYDAGLSQNMNTAAVIKTNDGGYIIAGESSNQIFLIKTDLNGLVQWNSVYTTSGFDIPPVWEIKQTTDGGYVFVGQTTQNSFGAAYVVKTDANGVIQWSNQYDAPGGWTSAFSIDEHANGGYIISGRDRDMSVSPQVLSAMLIRINSSGGVSWARNYQPNGNTSENWLAAVRTTSDNGFIATGITRAGSTSKIQVIKTDSTGFSGGCNEFNIGVSVITYPLITSSFTYVAQSGMNTLTVTPLESVPANLNSIACSSSICSVNLGNDTTLCQGAAIVLDAQNSGATYTWQDNSTNQTFTVTASGQYFVSVNDGGCIASDTINVTVESTPLSFTYSSGCPCNNLTFNTNTSSSSLVWTFNDNGATSTQQNPSHTYSEPGFYYVTLSDTSITNCFSDTTQIIEVCGGDIPLPSKSNNRWYFYTKSGVDFSSGSPLVVADGQMSGGIEGGATISHPKTGALLFYTNGIHVWNTIHDTMPNGFGLMGGKSAEQATLIVPFPDDTNKYYIFTIAGSTDGILPQEIRYSVIDMNLNSGLGDVIASQKNIFLANSSINLIQGNEALSGIEKKKSTCNNAAQYWLITTPNGTCGRYDAYLIDSNGVASTPVSTIFSSSFTLNCISAGYTAFSPNGQKVARATKEGIIILDFDKSTGLFSNPKELLIAGGQNNTYPYAVQFSPDNKFLYTQEGVASSTAVNLVQFDVTSSNILMSKVNLITTSNDIGSMWIGVDEKIYFARSNTSFLGVINNPNVQGVGSNVSLSGVFFSGLTVKYGLQNIVPLNLFLKDTLSANFNFNINNCNQVTFTNLTPQLTPQTCSFYNADTLTYSWNFGDGSPMSSNQNPTHTYLVSGIYTVELIVTRPRTCSSDTIRKVISTISVGTDTTAIYICRGDSILLGGIFQTIAGNYNDTLFGVSSTGCDSLVTTTLLIDTLPNITATLIPDTCNAGIGQILPFVSGNDPFSFLWSNNTVDSILQGLTANNYTLQVTDSNGCMAFAGFFLENVMTTCENTPNEPIIIIPNIITPNGDGMNETFEIVNLTFFPENNLKIFNRWGRKIFETDNYQNDWNGEDHNDGTYFYILEVNNESKDLFKGTITILK